MSFAWIAVSLSLALAVGMALCFLYGGYIGTNTLRKNPGGLDLGGGAAEAAIFALMGLLIAFTFSGAASRFENRRHLITQESNAIGTAYLRIGLLPEKFQSEIRSLFPRYIDIRAATYHGHEDPNEKNRKIGEATSLQKEIWQKSLIASAMPEGIPHESSIQLFVALNEMIDFVNTREMATRNHPPIVIFLLLATLILLSALMVGYNNAINQKNQYFHIAIFLISMSVASYVILELEFPRLGFVRIDAADQAFQDLKSTL